mmetsp:Transcript_29863/g.69022  ORF Transcript_29863/g.69022 Transcript_29863/m.69022 type:complete len:205 (-) Transcript_29863:702-1316(-)
MYSFGEAHRSNHDHHDQTRAVNHLVWRRQKASMRPQASAIFSFGAQNTILKKLGAPKHLAGNTNTDSSFISCCAKSTSSVTFLNFSSCSPTIMYMAPCGTTSDSPGVSLSALALKCACSSRVASVVAKNSLGVLERISGRASWICVFAPRIRVVSRKRPSRTSLRTSLRSCRSTQPNLHPGTRNRFARPPISRIGTFFDKDANE